MRERERLDLSPVDQPHASVRAGSPETCPLSLSPQCRRRAGGVNTAPPATAGSRSPSLLIPPPLPPAAPGTSPESPCTRHASNPATPGPSGGRDNAVPAPAAESPDQPPACV